MPDTKLVKCRAEREALKKTLAELSKLLDAPAQKTAKILHNERKVHRYQVQKLTHEARRLMQSNADLHEQLDPVRQALKTERGRSELLSGKLKGIHEHLVKLGHPLALGEPITEKLDNMQAIIKAQAHIAEVLERVWLDHPEVKEMFKEQFEKEQKGESDEPK